MAEFHTSHSLKRGRNEEIFLKGWRQEFWPSHWADVDNECANPLVFTLLVFFFPWASEFFLSGELDSLNFAKGNSYGGAYETIGFDFIHTMLAIRVKIFSNCVLHSDKTRGTYDVEWEPKKVGHL